MTLDSVKNGHQPIFGRAGWQCLSCIMDSPIVITLKLTGETITQCFPNNSRFTDDYALYTTNPIFNISSAKDEYKVQSINYHINKIQKS